MQKAQLLKNVYYLIQFLAVLLPSSIFALPSNNYVKNNEEVQYVSSELGRTSAGKKAIDLRIENLSLKEQQQVLIDYAKQLRDKYKNLQAQCLDTRDKDISRNSASHKNSLPECRKEEETVSLSEYQDLQRKYAELQDSITSSTNSAQKIALQLAEYKNKNEELENKLSEVQNEFSEYKSKNLSEELKVKVESLEGKIEEKNKDVLHCNEKLENAEKVSSKLPSIEKELLTLKNELLIRKSAAEILSDATAFHANTSHSNTSHGNTPQINTTDLAKVSNAKTNEVSPQNNYNSPSDVTIIEVTGNKVSLRAGPGTNHSPVMDLQKGTKLTVEAKENQWYRVFSPTGGRAFIDSSYTRVISGGVSANTRHSNAPNFRGSNSSTRARLEVEPVKPPLPSSATSKNTSSKPIRRIGKQIAEEIPSEGIEVPVGGSVSEELAIEKLMQAMSELKEKSSEQ